MLPPKQNAAKALVSETLARLERRAFGALCFPDELEEDFEESTRKARSFRLWAEGLVAIVGLNACLLLDSLFIRDLAWMRVIRDTLLITPIALLTNLLVYRNPNRWLREGSIAAAMVVICIANLWAQGGSTATGVLFGVICVLITALFVGVVMRLRFAYAASSIAAMAVSGFWALGASPAITAPVAIVAGSLMMIGLGIIVVASYSLERAERCSYLMALERQWQAEELQYSNRSLLRISRQDKLTGLPNRHAFEDSFERMWEQASALRTPLAAVLVDVDHFKQVNDRHGHLYGDATLRRVGTLLGQALRSEDDLVARYGGEEFVMLLEGADLETAMAVAERARRLVETAGTPAYARVRPARWITVSCGVCSYVPSNGGHRSDLIAAADEALYAAKRAGRNRTISQSYAARMHHEMAATLEFVVQEGTEPMAWQSATNN